MSNISSLAAPFIPLNSEEPLWEWDLPTDCLFLSEGAKRHLHMASPPVSMSDFYRLMPPDAAMELAASRETAIEGYSESIAQCGYVYNGMWLQEILLVLLRDKNGRARRVMGRIESHAAKDQPGFRNVQTLFFGAGLWFYDVTAGLIWRDQVCSAILGIDLDTQYPIAAGDCILPVHPGEKEALARHYRLFCGSPFLGDTITDVVRVRHADGVYKMVLCRAAAVKRSPCGRALRVMGLVAPATPQSAPAGARKQDFTLFNALDSMSGGQWDWDTENDSIYFCPRYLAMLGYSPERQTDFARSWRERIHPDDREKVARVHKSVIESAANGDSYECAYRMERADGNWAWIFDQGRVTWRDESGRAAHIIGSITNITTAQAERDRLEELVRHDALTGLRSRAFCMLEVEHIEQNGLRPASIISVDITGLKMVNDYLGHAKGDAMLIGAAGILRRALRRSDCIGRMGGDEFMVVLPGCDNRKGLKVLEKLKNAFDSYNAEHPDAPIFASMGMACAVGADQTMAETMAEADEQMYAHKKEQRKTAQQTLRALIFRETGREVGADERLGAS